MKQGIKVIRDPNWSRTILPNLPARFHNEYLTMLASYVPDVEVIHQTVVLNPSTTLWCFPFVDIPEDFDHGEYEDWCYMVEQDMIERYPSLNLYCFSS